MKLTYWSGVAVGALALFAMCRPASASDFVYSFTAGDLEAAIDADTSGNSGSGFGAGACGSNPGNFSAMCGVYEVMATPNLASATVTAVNPPSSAGSAGWGGMMYSGDAVYFSDFLGTTDTFLSFVTTNANTPGNFYDDLADSNFDPPEAKLALAASTLFYVEIATSDPITPAEAANVQWSLKLDVVPLNADGTENDNVLKSFWDTSLIGFQMNVVTPEPASGLLCLIGLAAWGLHRRRRHARIEAPSPPHAADLS